MTDLDLNHLSYAVREMYTARKQSVGQDNATERSWLLTAAAHADEVVCRVRHCDPDTDDRRKVPLWKDRQGVAHTVTLAQAERDAYDLLKWRADNSPNPFFDTGARWFTANGGHRKAGVARDGVLVA